MQYRNFKFFRRVVFSVISFITISIFFAADISAINLLDEFSSIYHSSVILEVGVLLGKEGYPKESCYLKTIKGRQPEVEEILKQFDICKKKKKFKPDQKRIMSFYRNSRGRLRSMDLIRQGIGPFSDEDNYLPFIKFVKLINRKLDSKKGEQGGIIVLDDKSICKVLLKNKYFSDRYRDSIDNGTFKVGGDAGAFKEFTPLVEIDCKNEKG